VTTRFFKAFSSDPRLIFFMFIKFRVANVNNLWWSSNKKNINKYFQWNREVKICENVQIKLFPQLLHLNTTTVCPQNLSPHSFQLPTPSLRLWTKIFFLFHCSPQKTILWFLIFYLLIPALQMIMVLLASSDSQVPRR
jgi:hypothetical protein